MASKNFIKLMKNPKEVREDDKEPIFETFVSPSFVPLRQVYDALDAMDADNDKEVSEREALVIMAQTICDIYGNKFTVDDILDRFHSPDAMPEIRSQIQFFAAGEMADQRKKELKAMLK